MWISVRHLGHLCVIDLNLFMQNGMRQQPATQLEPKEEQEINMRSQIDRHNNIYIILMQIFLMQQTEGFFIPHHRCHETHQPGHTAGGGEGLCQDELPTLRALCPGGTWWEVLHIQDHSGCCEEMHKLSLYFFLSVSDRAFRISLQTGNIALCYVVLL